MSNRRIYFVRVLDTRHQVTVMSGSTVAARPLLAAQQMCAARFGKWTGADSVEVATLGGVCEVFCFDDVAPVEHF